MCVYTISDGGKLEQKEGGGGSKKNVHDCHKNV
jgi:hypothetical protein